MNGELYGTGHNDVGQLGLGTLSTIPTTSFTKIGNDASNACIEK